MHEQDARLRSEKGLAIRYIRRRDRRLSYILKGNDDYATVYCEGFKPRRAQPEEYFGYTDWAPVKEKGEVNDE